MTDGYPAGADGAEHHPEIDWEAVERSPEFRELIRRKKAFVIPATAFFMAWYFGFIIDGLTVGYALALSQFVMTWVLGWLYLRKADRVFDPLAARAREAALATADTGATGGRFRRDAITDEPVTPSTTSEEVPRS